MGKSKKNIRNMIIICLSCIFATFLIMFLIYRTKLEKIKLDKDAEMQRLTVVLSEYDGLAEKILELNDSYNKDAKEIFELLYKSPYPNIILPFDSDKTYDKLKYTVDNMDENLNYMNQIKGFLISRKSFIDSFPFIWPMHVKGVPEITSEFGVRNNHTIKNIGGRTTDGLHNHAGIDLKLDIGDPIISTADGVVYQVWSKETYLGQHPIYGNLIIISHNYGFQTYYAHLNKVKVKKGKSVKRGDIIGEGGNTGMSEGAHIHYEIRLNGIAWDPMIFLGMTY